MKEVDLSGLSPKRLLLLALEQAEEIERLKAQASEPVAIVGIGCRFPGGVDSPDSYWELLRQGYNAIRPVPADRWDMERYYAEDPDTPGKMATRWGGFLDSVDGFDPEFFGMAPREVIAMDPQQRLALEVCWEALEDAAIGPRAYENQPVGVFLGVTGGDYIQLLSAARGVAAMDAYAMTGNARNAVAGRISYVLGLRGPSLVVDTACSSSLVAAHLACESLASRQCNVALAGGVNVILSPEVTVATSRAHMLAADGLCKTFDASADGFVRSEGCGMVVLKRLSDARADGDRVIALIRGSAINQDGHSGGFTVPNGAAQEDLLRQALRRAGISGADISCLEAHGTGTRLGDPVEVAAAARVLGEGRRSDRPLVIGSVKTNLGHLEAAAGIAGLIKVALALDRGQIPPHLHFRTVNPGIDFAAIPAIVPTEAMAWPARDGTRFAGVSSFGASGTNAHVVLEEASVRFSTPQAALEPAPGSSLLCISARTATALQQLAGRYAELLESRPGLSFAALCWTANTGRAEFERRLALVAVDAADAVRLLRASLDGRRESGIHAGEVVLHRAPEHLSPHAPLSELAAGWVRGKTIDWHAAPKPPDVERLSLPLSPFERRRFWFEDSRPSGDPAPVSITSAMTCTVVWRRASEKSAPPSEPVRWLIFADADAEWGRHTLPSGDEALIVSSTEPAAAEEIAARIAEWKPTAVVYSAVKSGSSALDAEVANSCWFAITVMQAVAHAAATPKAVFLVTRGAVGFGSAGMALDQAPIWGLGRTFLLEFPEVSVHLSDFDPDQPEPQLHELVAKLRGTDGEQQLAFRQDGCWVPRLVEMSSVPALTSAVRADATYLITGGLGGLGLDIAAALAEQGATRLLLLGRSSVSARARAMLEAMAARGVTVLVESVDVTQPAALAAVLDRHHDPAYPLRGVVHAAGIIDDATVLRQSRDTLARVLEPKVAGAWNLHTLTRGMPLDWFVLFSSTASLLGSPGQANYAAANAFEDALAHQRRALGLPALSINWGPWEGSGMMQSVDEIIRRRRNETGFRSLDRGSAVAAFLRLIQSASVPAQVAVTAFDWPRLATAFGKTPSFLAELCAGQEPAAPRRNLRDRLAAASSETARLSMIAEFVQQTAAGVLGRKAPLPPDQGFFDMGMDSLMALEMRNALQAELPAGTLLPSSLVFDQPDVARLTVFLATELGVQQTPSRPARPASREASGRIAIVGMGCRFPGGVRTPESFWDLLHSGGIAVDEIPADRWDVDHWYDPDPEAKGKMYTRRGAFLDAVDQFDAEFFGISPREAVNMDPQQRILLEVGWEALESAGVDPSRAPSTGVFIGISTNDYLQRMSSVLKPDEVDAYVGLGNSLSAAAGRISFHLGLSGPSMVLDTACSSSLVALHLACRSLSAHESNLALAGGVNLILTPLGNLHLSRARMLAPDGRSKAFDATADGYGRGEGCGVLALKRLEDALESGDEIHAVIRGSAVNHDGHSAGFTVPDGSAQRAVIRAALDAAGVEPREVSYIETHGTGTTLGDPIEVLALAGVFGAERDAGEPLWIGSVKANIGHLEAAAGVAGVIKTVLALRHAERFPQPRFGMPNPHIPWDRTPVRVSTVAAPWPALRGARVAGVSSFGFVGTNAHVILEAPPEQQTPALTLPCACITVLTLSAKSLPRLRLLAADYMERLAACAEDEFADLCYTANLCRAEFEHRIAIEAADREQARTALAAFLRGEPAPGLFTASAALYPEPDPAASRPAAAWVRGTGVDWAGLHPGHAHRRVRLPGSPFLRQRYWFDERQLTLAAGSSDAVELPLLGRQVSSPAMRDIVFASAIARNAPLWVADHRVHEVTVIPGAAHMAAVCQASLIQFGEVPMALNDVVFPVPNILDSDLARSCQLVMGKLSEDAFSFRVVSCESGRENDSAAWAVHADGRLSRGTPARHAPLDEARQATYGQVCDDARGWRQAPGEALYEQIAAVGVQLGPRFRWVEHLSYGAGRALGRLATPASEAGLYRVHPGLIDSCFQLVAAAFGSHFRDETAAEVFVPVSVGNFALKKAPGTALWCHAWADERDSTREGSIHGGFEVFDEEGLMVASATEVRMHRAPADALLRSRDSAVEDSLYEVAWRELPPLPEAPSGCSGWVVEGDDTTLGRLISQSLTGPPGIVYLCSATGSGGPGCATEDPSAGEEALRRCSELVAVAAAARTSPSPPARLYIVTMGAQPAADTQSLTHPEHACLWGLGRVLATEEPALNATLIDLDPWASEEENVRLLAAELAASGIETQLAFRNGQRLGARLTRWPAISAPAPQLHAATTYLIIGGTGALGLIFCRWLCQRGARRIVLASRRGNTPQALELASELAANGAEIRIVAADAGVREDVDRLIAIAHTEEAPLRGVLHAAGVVDDAPVSDMTPEGLARVLRPKMHAAVLLDRATRGIDLDFFVLFSSAAALLGSPGQGSYAAANACLDALAHARRSQGRPALSVNWGPWRDAGMAAAVWERLGAYWEAAGVEPIRAPGGIRALELLLASGRAQAAVFPVNWPRFVLRMPGRQLPTLLELVASPETTQPSIARMRILEAPEADRLSLLLENIREQIALVLGLGSAHAVDPDSRLFALGLDSIMALELRSRIERAFNLRLPSTLLFDYPTPVLVANFLFVELFGVSPEESASHDLDAYTHEELNRLIDQEYARTMGTSGAEDRVHDQL